MKECRGAGLLFICATVALVLAVCAAVEAKKDTDSGRKVTQLNEDNFEKEIAIGNWLVLYHDGKGKQQQRALKELLSLQEEQKAAFPLLLGMVDCRDEEDICLDAGFKTSARPAFALHREQIKGYVARVGDATTGEELMKAVEKVLLGDVIDLDFSHFPDTAAGPVTDIADDLPWIIMFKNNFCMHCRIYLPEWVRWAKSVHEKYHVAVVDCGKAPRVCQAHDVEVTPTVKLFPSSASPGIVFDKSRKWNVFFENYAPESLEAFIKEHITPRHDEL